MSIIQQIETEPKEPEVDSQETPTFRTIEDLRQYFVNASNAALDVSDFLITDQGRLILNDASRTRLDMRRQFLDNWVGNDKKKIIPSEFNDGGNDLLSKLREEGTE